MGAVEKRWTALTLEHEGVQFAIPGGGAPGVRGPDGRPDLVEALRAEIAWRVAALRVLRAGGTRLVLTPPPPTGRTSACECCGDSMRPFRGGHCALCILALVRLGREVRS